jgi:hypothetical protein
MRLLVALNANYVRGAHYPQARVGIVLKQMSGASCRTGNALKLLDALAPPLFATTESELARSLRRERSRGMGGVARARHEDSRHDGPVVHAGEQHVQTLARCVCVCVLEVSSFSYFFSPFRGQNNIAAINSMVSTSFNHP